MHWPVSWQFCSSRAGPLQLVFQRRPLRAFDLLLTILLVSFISHFTCRRTHGKLRRANFAGSLQALSRARMQPFGHYRVKLVRPLHARSFHAHGRDGDACR
eukprot:6182493-Pleurochrysis_carterae.AAC.2